MHYLTIIYIYIYITFPIKVILHLAEFPLYAGRFLSDVIHVIVIHKGDFTLSGM